MTKNEVEIKVKEIMIEDNEVLNDIEEIDGESTFDSLGLNSIMFIKKIVAIESEFDFELEDEELNMEKFNTINELISYIINKKGY